MFLGNSLLGTWSSEQIWLNKPFTVHQWFNPGPLVLDSGTTFIVFLDWHGVWARSSPFASWFTRPSSLSHQGPLLRHPQCWRCSVASLCSVELPFLLEQQLPYQPPPLWHWRFLRFYPQTPYPRLFLSTYSKESYHQVRVMSDFLHSLLLKFSSLSATIFISLCYCVSSSFGIQCLFLFILNVLPTHCSLEPCNPGGTPDLVRYQLEPPSLIEAKNTW